MTWSKLVLSERFLTIKICPAWDSIYHYYTFVKGKINIVTLFILLSSFILSNSICDSLVIFIITSPPYQVLQCQQLPKLLTTISKYIILQRHYLPTATQIQTCHLIPHISYDGTVKSQDTQKWKSHSLQSESSSTI